MGGLELQNERKTAEKNEVKKVKKITLRVSEEEDKLLKEYAKKEGLTINDFIRVKLLKFKPPKRNPSKGCEEVKRFLYEINRIGVNLNQIAKFANSLLKRGLITGEECLNYLEQIANTLEKIEKEINILMLEVLNDNKH